MTRCTAPKTLRGPMTARVLHALLWLGASQFAAAAMPPDTTTRCGWFDNPTPGNATLVDKDGEWTIGMQGGHQAEGDWPTFPKSRWVATGTGSAGYGCACLKLSARADTQEVTHIFSSGTQALSVCRKDKALTGKEPENPLK